MKSANKRAILRAIYNSVAEGETLKSTIEGYLSAKFTNLKTGKVLTSSSRNGQSVGYQVVPGISDSDLTFLYNEFLEVIDYIETEYPTLTSDADIFAQINNEIQGIKFFTTDFSAQYN